MQPPTCPTANRTRCAILQLLALCQSYPLCRAAAGAWHANAPPTQPLTPPYSPLSPFILVNYVLPPSMHTSNAHPFNAPVPAPALPPSCHGATRYAARCPVISTTRAHGHHHRRPKRLQPRRRPRPRPRPCDALHRSPVRDTVKTSVRHNALRRPCRNVCVRVRPCSPVSTFTSKAPICP